MKQIIRAFLFVFTLLPTAALALDPVDSIDLGLKLGANVPNYVQADPAFVAGGTLRYRHREYPAFAIEADAVATVLEGEVAAFDYSVSSLAAYLAWRSAGNLYLKFRAGGLMEYVSVGSSRAFGGGLSGSVAAGIRYGEQSLEIELTGVEKAAYMVTVNWFF